MKEEIKKNNISLNWIDLTKPTEYTAEHLNTKNAIFHIEPLEKGFGVTLGNSLRRVLLSSLQGTAICAVKIYGVEHEYSTMDCVQEDIIEIILNLKSIIIKGSAGFSSKKFTLNVTKKGEITAGMINVTPGFEIINPDLVICNTSASIKLEMDMMVVSGKGYKVSGDHDRLNNADDLIFIDSIFSPVSKCSFDITNSRVGSKTEYDKLSLNITTNGSIKPDLALALAAKIFQEQLQVFINFKEVREIEKPKKKKVPFDINLLKKVSDLELSVRSQNCLQNDNILYIGDLVVKSEMQMLKTSNFGKKSLNEIKGLLVEKGFNFGMKIPNWPPLNIEELIEEYHDKE
jgi:DNA-directed RNA polymerase subunit alpha